MVVPFVSRMFIYTAVVAVIAGAAMAHRPTVVAPASALAASHAPAGLS